MRKGVGIATSHIRKSLSSSTREGAPGKRLVARLVTSGYLDCFQCPAFAAQMARAGLEQPQLSTLIYSVFKAKV